MRGVLQIGNEVTARWRARLDEHLGTLTLEPDRAHAGAALAFPRRLAGLAAACAIADTCLPERIAYPGVHAGMRVLLEALDVGEGWGALYVRWEAGLLADLGYGLDLSRCAVTGIPDDLAFVSPRTGRAVARDAAAPYAERLLRLPPFLLGGQSGAGAIDIVDGMALTGHFLEKHLLAPFGKTLPPARDRLLDLLKKTETLSDPTPPDDKMRP